MRLIASLGFNLIAKLPSVLGLLVVLPLISRHLGAKNYGEFLAMLALGSTFTFFFGGINTVTRRRLSFAYSSGDIFEQSKAISAGVTAGIAVALAAGIATAFIANLTASSWSLIVVATIPVIGAFANILDNVRAAYNEHYITAILQTIAQCVIYGCAIIFSSQLDSVIVCAMVLNLPLALASVLTFVLLCRERRGLKFAVPRDLGHTIKSASYVVLADGAVSSALSGSLYGLGAVGATELAAWYGTLMRAFQALLAPILLIMLPLTSFVSLRWVKWNTLVRQRALRNVIAVAVIYGFSVGLTFALGGNHYLETFFPQIQHPSSITPLCVAAFFGVIVAQKMYVQLIYSVSEARQLSIRIFSSISFGTCAGLASQFWLSSTQALNLFCVSTSVTLLFAILSDQAFRRKAL
ncbi:O-antigen/teichoic acid export membrane protein [Bradyrhizobium sp. JR4.1]|uniref:hypothetical protein n=1 Tax=Bradyrhizobium sp. JR4.1 TaxID=3156372 RepID=UPI00339B335E